MRGDATDAHVLLAGGGTTTAALVLFGSGGTTTGLVIFGGGGIRHHEQLPWEEVLGKL